MDDINLSIGNFNYCANLCDFKSSYKTKNLFLTANVLFLLGLIVDAIAPSFVFLLLGRVIQGIATGIALPLMFNIILEQVPKSKIGTMMGVGNLITGAAPALGPTFGGIVINSCCNPFG